MLEDETMPHLHLSDVLHRVKIVQGSALASLLNRAISTGAKVRLPKSWSGSNPERQETMVVHELRHIESQGFHPLYAIFIWWPIYFISKKFRAIQEMKAYWAHMDHFKYCWETGINYDVVVSNMTCQHFGAISGHLAKALVHVHKKGMPEPKYGKFYNDYKKRRK